MNTSDYASRTPPVLSEKEFKRLSEYVYEHLGIKLPPVKKTLLESRLQRRLRFCNLQSFGAYCDYLFSPQGTTQELPEFINTVTTNKTDFFREPEHFDYLIKKALPDLLNDPQVLRRKLTLWSAGCSKGDEPYTLGMVLKNFFEQSTACRVPFSILATDISTNVLKTAISGVYNEEMITPVPMELRKKYLLKSKDRSQKIVRIAPEIRNLITFRQLNLMDQSFDLRDPVDIIFCRNVIIYFDRPTQERLFNKFCRYLSPGGYVFIGHSETLQGMEVPLVQVSPTVYKKKK
ncbi:protein-glutamate O-methyltransferase [Deltaproteobacteria bacterium TL4]